MGLKVADVCHVGITFGAQEIAESTLALINIRSFTCYKTWQWNHEKYQFFFFDKKIAVYIPKYVIAPERK